MTTLAKEAVISCLIERINKDCKVRTFHRDSKQILALEVTRIG